MFIPDANAPDIKENYKEFCYDKSHFSIHFDKKIF